MSALRISKTVSLPTESVTKTFAILAQRRKGKTYTASVMAEEMVKAGLPWVALDPTGAWWGLRAGADGKEKGGLRVYVFGGDHGDLPLERTAGKQIADLVVEHPGHYVLDFSHFESKEAERQLATDFAERFYRRKGRDKAPMHLFVDEADMFVPQRSPRGDQRMLGAFESLVRRGGIRGIGTTLISQRAAVVNKNVLEQIDVLIALRTVGPNDRKALEGYVEAHGSVEEKRDLMGSIASLDLGEAWIWEPGADLFARVQIRERHTFNSSATPDGKASEPVGLADVDLDALRGKLDHAVEQAKANDPAELKKRVRELERELKKRPTEKEMVEVEKIVEIPVMANGAVDKLGSVVEAMAGVAEGLRMDLARVADAQAGRTRNVAQRQVRAKPSPPPRERRREPAGDVGEAHTGQVGGGEVKLNRRAERMALSALIQHPEGLTTKQLAITAGYSHKGGGFLGALSKLRSMDLISPARQEPITVTEAGIAALPDVEPLPTGRALLDHWLGQMKRRAEREVLLALYEAYPDSLSAEEIAERAGYEPTGGGFLGAVSKLRTLKLIEGGKDAIRASDDLFEAVTA